MDYRKVNWVKETPVLLSEILESLSGASLLMIDLTSGYWKVPELTFGSLWPSGERLGLLSSVCRCKSHQIPSLPETEGAIQSCPVMGKMQRNFNVSIYLCMCVCVVGRLVGW